MQPRGQLCIRQVARVAMRRADLLRHGRVARPQHDACVAAGERGEGGAPGAGTEHGDGKLLLHAREPTSELWERAMPATLRFCATTCAVALNARAATVAGMARSHTRARSRRERASRAAKCEVKSNF